MVVTRFATAAAALAVLIGVVALASGAPRPLGLHQGSGQVGPGLVDYAFTTATIVFVAVLVAGLLAAVKLRARWQPPQRNSWRALLLFLAVALALAVVQSTPLRLHGSEGGSLGNRTNRPPLTNARPRSTQRDVHFKWIEAAIAGALAAAVLAALAATRARRRRVEPEPPPAAEQVALALEDTLDDLRRERDVRRAIVAAYARMELALAASGLPRRASEAPLEYLQRALRQLATTGPAVTRLTDLFERAKFSVQPLGGDTKEEAIAALIAVRDELRAAA
jgi:hypothetical protein